MSSSEVRRLRLEMLEHEQDMRPRDQTIAPEWFLGTVTGSPPATVPAYFKVQPQSIKGTPSEGGTATLTSSPSGPVLVYVLGPSVPTAGQTLACQRAGGGWVAETCCGTTDGCLACSPCQIPKKDLRLTYVDHTYGTFVFTLVYFNNTWITACAQTVGFGSWNVFSFACFLGVSHLSQASWPEFNTTCSGVPSGSLDWESLLVDYTCNPYHRHYHLVGSSTVDLYIDDPGPATVCGLNCVTCGGNIPSTLFVTDILGTYTATWNGSFWVTPQLSVTNTLAGGWNYGVGDCSGGSPVCHGGLVSGSAAYRYVITCIDATHLGVRREWGELYPACVQYAPSGCSGVAYNAYDALGSAVTCGSISGSGTLAGGSANMGDPFSNPFNPFYGPGVMDVSFSQ